MVEAGGFLWAAAGAEAARSRKLEGERTVELGDRAATALRTAISCLPTQVNLAREVCQGAIMSVRACRQARPEKHCRRQQINSAAGPAQGRCGRSATNNFLKPLELAGWGGAAVAVLCILVAGYGADK